MKPRKTDLSVYNELHFERPPIAVKFLFRKPEGIKQLEGSMALCAMIREAQAGKEAFYATVENEDCVGKLPLGWIDAPPAVESGQMGPEFDIYDEPRANAAIYQHVYKIARGTVNYVVFSPLDKVTFEPDLLILAAGIDTAEIVLRALSYSTGEPWMTMGTPVLQCSWLFAYPYITGKVNYCITGIGHGMRSKEIFPKGLILMSIPYQKIPMVTQNLNEVSREPWCYTIGKEKFAERELEILNKFGGVTRDGEVAQ
jgi:uncharacterized protein (DUF169 family)